MRGPSKSVVSISFSALATERHHSIYLLPAGKHIGMTKDRYNAHIPRAPNSLADFSLTPARQAGKMSTLDFTHFGDVVLEKVAVVGFFEGIDAELAEEVVGAGLGSRRAKTRDEAFSLLDRTPVFLEVGWAVEL